LGLIIHFSSVVDTLTNVTSNGDEAEYNSHVLLNLENAVGFQ